jgi:uncharacterized membrane protein/protein-disulfide isomerase
MKPNQTQSLAPHSKKTLHIIMLLVALAGLVVCAELSLLHWQVNTQPGFVSFCAINETVNCDTVALSRFSVVFGVPVSTWGILFFLAVIVLCSWALLWPEPGWPWGLLGALLYSGWGAAVFLFLIAKLHIGALCPNCIALYIILFVGALIASLGLKQVQVSLRTSIGVVLFTAGCAVGLFAALLAYDSYRLLLTAVVCILMVIAVWLWFPHGGRALLQFARRILADMAITVRRPLFGGMLYCLALLSVTAVVVLVPRLYPDIRQSIAGGSVDIATGCTPEGDAWIGALNPEVVVVEFSDYECPHCCKAHEPIRELVRENRTWLRLVHVHMPLDKSCNQALSKPFHRHSCDCARAAICAAEQDCFWEMNDRLFLRRGGLDVGGLAILAENLGLNVDIFRVCMRSTETERKLQADLERCSRQGIVGTPSFLVGNQLVKGERNKQWWIEFFNSLRKGDKPLEPNTSGGAGG